MTAPVSTAVHAPKIAALQAYSDDVLSKVGKARVERHLAACEPCRRALAAIELYRRTATEVREAEAPELDWGKMELTLAREARTIAEQHAAAAKSRRVPSEAWVALAVAAAAILALAWPRTAQAPVAEQRPRAVVPHEPEPVAVPEAPAVLASVTLVSGRAIARSERARTGEADRALEVGSTLAVSDVIATEAGSSVHASILLGGAEGSGLALAASSELTLGGDDRGIELALAHGSVVASVEPERIAAGSRFVVLAAEHRLEAHGTRFEVALEGGVVTLGVAEGEVAVHTPAGEVVIVRAPGTWSSAGGELEAEALAEPYGVGPAAAGWPVVEVAREGIVRWEIGSYAVEGTDVLAMRAPPGELALAGFDASGRAFRTVAIVGADGLTIDAAELVPEPPRVREGTLELDEIQPVVNAGRRALTQCYERALRSDDERLAGTINVEITVAFDGSVSRIRPLTDVPPELDQCLQTHIARWIFPPPHGNGSFRFRAPFSFQPR